MSSSNVLIRLSQVLMTLTAMAILTGAAAAAQQDRQAASGEQVRHFGYVTMRDGIRLAYVVYLPKAKGRFPAVLQYEPYQGGGSDPGGTAGMWLENGYAVVFASVRGTGCSQGALDLFGPDEGPDGAAIIDWIGKQSWSDRRVGMVGVSYPGHTQILVAAQHPKFLYAITPSAVTANTYSEIAYPGGIFNVGFAAGWSLHLQPWVESLGIKARIGWGDTECERNYLAHRPSRLPLQGRAHPFFDQWWQIRSLEEYVDRVAVPTFISGTWQDNETMASGTTELYERLKAPKRMSMSPGGHAGVYTEAALQQDLVQWMNRWVKGVHNGIEEQPPIKIYWEPAGNPPVAGWTTSYSSWPPKRTKLQTFWLGATGTLSADPPGKMSVEKGLSYTFPTGVELVGDNVQFAVPPDPNGSVTWTSAPFDGDLTILGRVQVSLYVASENPDTDIEVALHDVYPNGDVQYLQRGFLRASLRAIDRHGIHVRSLGARLPQSGISRSGPHLRAAALSSASGSGVAQGTSPADGGARALADSAAELGSGAGGHARPEHRLRFGPVPVPDQGAGNSRLRGQRSGTCLRLDGNAAVP